MISSTDSIEKKERKSWRVSIFGDFCGLDKQQNGKWRRPPSESNKFDDSQELWSLGNYINGQRKACEFLENVHACLH